jgi:leader peptidase (prepilin peptidase)/N-methyltransferase
VDVLLSIFAALFGLILGSFLNVCISRLPNHESVVSPRSRCPRCAQPIRSFDNIPVLSWILLGGRCRDCKARISVRYALIEAATAMLFLLCALEFGLTVLGAGAAVLCWLLLGLAATDAETMLLPDALTLPGIALGVVFSGFVDSGLGAFAGFSWPGFSWKESAASLLWAACGFGVILLIRGLYWLARKREGIGLGDAKLLAMIAAWLGIWQAGLVLFLAVVCAALYGLGILLGRRISKAKDGDLFRLKIPLGAFLSAAGIFCIFKGPQILNWYLGFFP